MDQDKKASRDELSIRQSYFVLLIKIVGLELLFITIYLIFRLPQTLVQSLVGPAFLLELSAVGILFFIILSLIKVMFMAYVTVFWANEFYLIRKEVILHRKGVFSTKEETYSLKNVEAFTVNQDAVGKMFNFGTISFFSPVLKKEYHLTNISSPFQLKTSIENMVLRTKPVQTKGQIIPVRTK